MTSQTLQTNAILYIRLITRLLQRPGICAAPTLVPRAESRSLCPALSKLRWRSRDFLSTRLLRLATATAHHELTPSTLRKHARPSRACILRASGQPRRKSYLAVYFVDCLPSPILLPTLTFLCIVDTCILYIVSLHCANNPRRYITSKSSTCLRPYDGGAVLLLETFLAAQLQWLRTTWAPRL